MTSGKFVTASLYGGKIQMISEDMVEQQALAWLQAEGWTYIHGTELSPEHAPGERPDGRAVVLAGRLRAAVEKLNPGLPAETVESVVRTVTTREHPDLGQANRAFHKLLLEGVKIEVEDASADSGKRPGQPRLMNFTNAKANDWLAVNQFSIVGSKCVRRPDIILFVNGLPLGAIELKNPADLQTDIWEAYAQLQTYKNEISDLYVYNAALAISDGVKARIGSLTANAEWFMPWRTLSGPQDKPTLTYELEKVIRGFYKPELFLDYLRYFVLFEDDGDEVIKKIAGYHQFHGVRSAVEATLHAQKERGGEGKAGVFWHTQGSGKSISMAMYAGKLLQQPAMRNPTLVVVTDRNDLDGQLFGQFAAASDLLRQSPEQAESREELRDKLTARAAGGVIFTTVQKFAPLEGEDTHPVLCDRSNVVVISDEAHRSQYGMKPRLDKATGKYVYGYAKHMRDALPNASFIGFTGTPIASEDKDTRGVFGEYVSIYDIQDAVDDGATVPIYYESRRAKLDLNRSQIDELNEQMDAAVAIGEDEEDVAEREKTKGKWAQLAKLVGAKPRLEAIAQDLVDHYEKRTEAIEGKAMIVTMSREICIALFDEIVKLRPDWGGTKREDGTWDVENGSIRVVMTGTATDRAELRAHTYSKQQKDRLASRFKKASDELRLVIVRDMWLTGFDAPCCHTMYVDKPMQGHGLMQAIARVNRVFKDKPGGLVVDYIGIGAELKSALKTYTESQGRGQPTVKAEDGLSILKEKLDTIRGMMASGGGFDYSGFRERPLELLVPATDHLLGLEGPDGKLDGKKRFLDVMASITRAYSLCATLDEAANLREEVAFFSAIRGVLVKHTTASRRGVDGNNRDAALKQILDNAVVSEGVDDIFELAGLDRPNIGLLSEEFLADVRAMPSRHLALELLERLLRDEIKSKSRNNVVQERKYGERLDEALRRYNNRAIETGKVIEELIAMAEAMSEDSKRDKELGLSHDEIAFYDALAENPEVLREMGDETLRKLAVELTDKLRNSTSVDWQVRDSVRAKMRLLVKRLLRKYKYPPEGQDQAVTVVLEQAESLAVAWSQSD